MIRRSGADSNEQWQTGVNVKDIQDNGFRDSGELMRTVINGRELDSLSAKNNKPPFGGFFIAQGAAGENRW
jgi:hypothetical protein